MDGGKIPPCDTCRPGVHPLNENAYSLWDVCRGQWRYSFNGEEALDLLAIESGMRIMGVPEEDKYDLAKQVQSLAEVYIGAIRSDRAKRAQQQD